MIHPPLLALLVLTIALLIVIVLPFVVLVTGRPAAH